MVLANVVHVQLLVGNDEALVAGQIRNGVDAAVADVHLILLDRIGEDRQIAEQIHALVQRRFRNEKVRVALQLDDGRPDFLVDGQTARERRQVVREVLAETFDGRLNGDCSLA